MKTLALLIAATAVASASPVTVTYLGTLDGLNDGTFYVAPYKLTVSDISFTVLATCYDVFDDVAPNQTWQANELTIDQAANGGYFSPNALAGYEKVGYLYDQSTAATSDAQRIGLQHAIWDVFGSTAPEYINHTHTAEEDQYVAAANTAAAGGYLGYTFSNLIFLEQTGGVHAGDPNVVQGFVFTNPNTGTQVAGTPEPGTFALLGTGAALIGLGYRRRSNRIGNRS